MSTTITEFEIVPAFAGLDAVSKSTLEVAFSEFFADAHRIADEAALVTEARAARAARLKIKNLRVAAEKRRVVLKADSLRMGKAIDGANNILLALIVPIERGLQDIELAEERAEAARFASLQSERSGELEFINFSPIPGNLGSMIEDQWQVIYKDACDFMEFRAAKEAAAKAEAEALAAAQAAEREAQRLENIRLRAEADAAAAALAVERQARAEADTKAALERKKIEEAGAKQRAIEKASRDNAEAAAAEERRKILEASAKAEGEAKALRDAEAKRVADQKAAEAAHEKTKALAAQKAAAAPDKAKLMHFADVVRHLEIPLANSERGQLIATEIAVKCEWFAKWIETEISYL